MAKQLKESIYVPTVDLKYESQAVENRVKTLFPDKNITCGALYHNLNDSEKNRLEKISHYQIAQGLHERITNIDAFFSGRKTLKSCNHKGNLLNGWPYILISMFTSIKESYAGKKGNSWENLLDQINGEDLVELDIRNKVNIINGPADKITSDKWIISEIRNALNHTPYVFLGGKTIYIKNPKTGFEADVSLKLLYDFIYFVVKQRRKIPAYGIDADDKSIYFYPNNYKFDDVKDKVHYKVSTNSIKKQSGTGVRNFAEYKNMLQKSYKDGSLEIDRKEKEIYLSYKLENLVKTYFNENGKKSDRKGHKIDYKNLKYIGMNLLYPPEGAMWGVLEHIRRNLSEGNSKFYLSEFVDEFGVYVNDAFGAPAYQRGESDLEIKELVEFERKLRGQKLGSGLSILRQLSECFRFAKQYFKDCGYKRVIKIEDGKEVPYFKLGNIEIKLDHIFDVCGALNGYYFASCQIVESFPDWIKIQFIESVYVNELITLKDDNVPGLMGGGVRNSNDKFTNREHVRNALVHNNYTMLHGVDEVVLRDGYNKKTDTWEREETINLPKLYDETYKEVSDNMSKESNLKIVIDKDSFANC